MGNVGGSIYYGIKGARMAPKGARLQGSLSTVQARAPVLGGQFAIWGLAFACCDCTLSAVRQKEDPWNSIISGAATGGILAVRAGPRAMASAAVIGGVLLAMIEGIQIMMNKAIAPGVPSMDDHELARQQALAPPTTGGLFPSGGFGQSSPATTAPPPSDASAADPSPSSLYTGVSISDGTTTFQTEDSAPSDDGSSGSGGSWWPFGASSP